MSKELSRFPELLSITAPLKVYHSNSLISNTVNDYIKEGRSFLGLSLGLESLSDTNTYVLVSNRGDVPLSSLESSLLIGENTIPFVIKPIKISGYFVYEVIIL